MRLALTGCGEEQQWSFTRLDGDIALFDRLGYTDETSTDFHWMWRISEEVTRVDSPWQRVHVRVRIKRDGSDVEAVDCNPAYADGTSCVAWKGSNNNSDDEACYFYGKTFQSGGKLVNYVMQYTNGAWGTRKIHDDCVGGA